VRLNDGSRRSGAFELRVRHPPVIQDLGGTEAAMSSPLGSTHALEPKSIPNDVGRTPYWAHVAETCLKFAVGQFLGRVLMSNVHAALLTEVKRVKTRMYLRPIRGRSRWP